MGRDNGLFNVHPEFIGEIEVGFFFFSLIFFCLAGGFSIIKIFSRPLQTFAGRLPL